MPQIHETKVDSNFLTVRRFRPKLMSPSSHHSNHPCTIRVDRKNGCIIFSGPVPEISLLTDNPWNLSRPSKVTFDTDRTLLAVLECSGASKDEQQFTLAPARLDQKCRRP